MIRFLLRCIFIGILMISYILPLDIQSQGKDQTDIKFNPIFYTLPDITRPLQEILNDNRLKEFGFPFNQKNVIAHNPDLLKISDQLLHHLDNEITYNKTNQYIHQLSKQDYKNIAHLPVQNAGVLKVYKQGEKAEDFYSFATSIYYMQDKVDFENIILFLKYSKIHIGRMEIAYEYPSAGTISSIHAGKNLTEEERERFWPAANAILRYPKKSVPALIQVVEKEENASDYLKMVAATFLYIIDPLLVDDIIQQDIPGHVKEKLICLRNNLDKSNRPDWRNVVADPCSYNSGLNDKYEEGRK